MNITRYFMYLCSLNKMPTILSCSWLLPRKILELQSRVRIMSVMDSIYGNNERIREKLTSLQRELAELQQEYASLQRTQLSIRNSNFLLNIGRAVAQLNLLETRNGRRHISVPGAARTITTNAANDSIPPHDAMTDNDDKPSTSTAQHLDAGPSKRAKQDEASKPPKETKHKKVKQVNAAPNGNPSTSSTSSNETPIDVGRLDMRVGKIIEISNHPDADSLYVEKIDCGEDKPRTIISGLVKFVPIEEMKNRMVVVLCNLKPVKMRGIMSEGMVMCASTPDKVEVLNPPAGAVPGDLIHCEGYTRNPDPQLNPKKKIFETCAPDLKTNDMLIACYKEAPLHIPDKGQIVAQTLKSVQVK